MVLSTGGDVIQTAAPLLTGVSFELLGLGPLQKVFVLVSCAVLSPGPRRCNVPLQGDKFVAATVFVLIEMFVELAFVDDPSAATLGKEPIGDERTADVFAVDT